MANLDLTAQLTMDFIPSATRTPVVTVAENDTLARARTLMELNDYSQLPVIRGKSRQAVGIVSWQSIGKALLRDPKADLGQCIDRSIKQVAIDSDLIAAIETVNADGYVIVVGHHKTISGIVTSADVGEALAGIARPYLSISACEQALRRLVDACIQNRFLDRDDVDSTLLDANKSFDGDVNTLAFGDLVNILNLPAAWQAVGAGYEKKALLDQIYRVGSLRNKIMHFRKQNTEDEELALLLPSVVTVLTQMVAFASVPSAYDHGTLG